VFPDGIAMLGFALATAIEQLGGARIPAFLFGVMMVAAAIILSRLKPAARSAGGGLERSAEILETLQDGFVALDGEFRFTYVNHAAEILMEKSKTEVLGK